MKTTTDRDPISTTASSAVAQHGIHERKGDVPQADTADLLAALWRYRWAVILPAIAGGILGFIWYLQTPETYRSSSRLIVESDRPAVLDSTTGDWVSGVPSIDVVRSQLFSDKVVTMAFESPRFQPFQDRFAGNVGNFMASVQENLKLESEIDDIFNVTSLVTLLHYDSTDPELCQAAVDSFSDSLQTFFNQKQKTSRGELIRLIQTAMEHLHPKMLELEDRYRDFRRDAPLAWNSEGEAINPHRERGLFLVQRRSELTEQLRQASIELASVESIAETSSSDPLLALNIIGQLLNKSFVMPTPQETREDLRQSDNTLAQIELDQQLVPLMIERNKYEAEFGPNHPTVRALDSELATMKNELKKLVEKETSRIVELMEQGRTEAIDPSVRAQEAVNAVIFAAKAQVALLEKQIEEVDSQISNENGSAAKLAQVEQENQAQLREIERTRELLDQLEEQMARVSLVEEDGGTSVVELTAPSVAYKIAPKLMRCLGFGAFIGLVFGAGFALLLEKNANTFRDPDEISDLLGVPVLTHIPFFKGRSKKLQKGETSPYEELDPYLAVIHSPASVAAEAIRSCRTSVFFETAGPGGKIVQVTSPLPGDGKSTIAGNLACSIAQSGKRVLAIDCDLRRPQLTANFALTSELGLTNVLNGDCEPAEACHQTPLTNLQVMPSGPIPANPAEALTLPEMQELLDLLRDQYDYIIVDTPPLLVVTDPSITASMVDGVILAVRVRRKSKPNSRESVNILRAVGAGILGIVINNSDEASISDGYRGYGYYRYGRYTSRYYRRPEGTDGTGGKRNITESSRVMVSGRGVAPLRKAETTSGAEDVSSDLASATEVPTHDQSPG